MCSKSPARAAYLPLLLSSLVLSRCEAGEKDWQPIQVSGRIVDSAGKPVSGARCLWDWSSPGKRQVLVEAASNADGRFDLKELSEVAASAELRANGTLWFLADGFAVQWLQYDLLPPAAGHRREVDISLKPVQPFAYLVTDPDGRPRLGELVEPMNIISSTMMIQPPRPIREMLSGTTDDAGLFRVNYLAADQGMIVRVMSERFGTIQQSPHLKRGPPPIVPMQFPRTSRVAGSIVAETPELFAGARVKVSSSPTEPGPPGIFGTAEATVDEHGRFHVPAIAEGSVSFSIDAPGQPEFSFGKQGGERIVAGVGATVNIPAVQLIRITGRVNGSGGQPPQGSGTVTVSSLDRNSEITLPFGEDGRFQGWTYPGDVRLRAELKTCDGVPVGYGSVVAQSLMRIDPGAKSVESPVLELPGMKRVSGLALSRDHQPLIGAVIYASLGKSSGAQVRTDGSGHFDFMVSETTPVVSYMYRSSPRTLMSFERSNDPLVLHIR